TITDAWVEPAFLSLALPLFLGVKVVATASSNLIYTDDQEFTASSDPIYASDQEFVETVKLDGPAGFWNLLNTSPSLRLDEVENALTRLLIVYSLHLDNRSKKPDARWQALNGTVRDLVTDVLNIFAIADEGFR
ncbi:MAG: type I-D CRISPR-associated protein Cas10d/Csc3, partial [Dolichospermum sp.]